MDALDQLPVSDDDSSESQASGSEAVMNKYFEPKSSTSSKDSASPWKSVDKWKIVGMAAVAFLVLANPWTQGMLSQVPYFGGNDMTTMVLSLLLFVILMIAIVMFAC